MRWGQPLWNKKKTMKSCVSSACDYSGPSQPHREIRTELADPSTPPPTLPPHYYILVLRGKHVPQRSANRKVIHQQNEIINVINTCSHIHIPPSWNRPGGSVVVVVLWGGGTLEGSARHLSTRRSLSPLSHQGVWGNFGLILLTLFNDVDVVKAPVLWGCESESHQAICSIKSAQKN